MAMIAEYGPYRGNTVRRARKSWTCDEIYGWGEHAVTCNAPIEPGMLYVEGDVNIDDAGGFGRFRICFKCAGIPS